MTEHSSIFLEIHNYYQWNTNVNLLCFASQILLTNKPEKEVIGIIPALENSFLYKLNNLWLTFGFAKRAFMNN